MWDPRSYEDTDYGLEPGESFEPEDPWEADVEEVSTAGPHVMTVLGAIDPQDLGICLMHEHLLRQPTSATAREPDHWLDNEGLISEEIEAFVAMGGRAIVDSSTPDYGRDAAGLVRLAMRAPVHVTGVTGRSHCTYSSCVEESVDVERLTGEFVVDLLDGMGQSSARAGMLRIGTGQDKISEVEEAFIQAAAQAHSATGAPVMISAKSGTTVLEQLNVLLRAGMDPTRAIVGGLDRKLEWDQLVAVAETGAFIAFDGVSRPGHTSDAKRAAMLVSLAEAGYADRLLISHGHERRSSYISYGGQPGITYILERFSLELMDAGAEALLVRNMLIENPAQALTIHPPAS